MPPVAQSQVLPPPTKVTDPNCKDQFQQLNLAIQAAFKNLITQIFNQLGISQVQHGSVAFNGTTASVTFGAPFPDTTYALMLSGLVTPTAITKTTTGFSVTLGAGSNEIVDWMATY